MALNLTARILLPYALVGALVAGALGTVAWVDRQRAEAIRFTQVLASAKTNAHAITARVQSSILTKDVRHAVAAAQLATQTHELLMPYTLKEAGAKQVLTQFQAFFAGVVAIQSVYLENRLEEGAKRISQVQQLQADIDKTIASELGRSQATQDRWQAVAYSVMGLALLVIVLLSSVMAWVLRHTVVKPVQQVAQALSDIAGGSADLTATLPVSRVPEVGQIATAFNAVMAHLRENFLEVRSATDSIRVASKEIASAALDLSQRTERTATDMQTALNALRSMDDEVHRSTDTVQSVASLVKDTARVAQQGGAVVSQVVNTMNEINQSSQKISDIIGVIDGIAFQTNILALNAAVEAARAGEAGRGFAVVATEVRALAGRSAQASKEIKALIDTSVSRVSAGTALVTQAGETMNQVVQSVERVVQTFEDISAASAHESKDIDQVTNTLASVEQSTQQDAAMVEETLAATQSLADQANRLGQIVGTFKLG